DHRVRVLRDAARRAWSASAGWPGRAPGVRGAARLELGTGEAVPLPVLRHRQRHAAARCGIARPRGGSILPPDRHGGPEPAPLTGPRAARGTGAEDRPARGHRVAGWGGGAGGGGRGGWVGGG